MSVVATFCSFRKTSIIDGQVPMISPKRLSFSSATSFSLSARSALKRSASPVKIGVRLRPEDRQDVELASLEEALHAVVAHVEDALCVALPHEGAHITLDI